MPSTSTIPPRKTVSRFLGVTAVLFVGVAAGYVLLPGALTDVFFAGWTLSSVGIAIVGGVGAWTERTPLVWLAALLLTGLSVLGMWSFGGFIAPAALLLLGTAVFLQLTGPREGAQEAILADPPTSEELTTMVRTGSGSVLGGALLVGVGAFSRGLFGACATETLSCVLARTHWGAVGLTVLGLFAIGYGGFLLWKQAHVRRLLASNPRTR